MITKNLQSLRDYALNVHFDEKPYMLGTSKSLDWDCIKDLFKQKVSKTISSRQGENMGLLVRHGNKVHPTFGAMILFGQDRLKLFPGAVIRCARFLGNDRVTILDQIDIDTYLPLAIEEVLHFVRRNTRMGALIEELQRKDIPEYPPVAIREALVNAIVHADYTLRGVHITVAIFNDRIEITNPGTLPFGLTLENAVSGASKLRNIVIARIFRELRWIEQWGSGIRRILDACAQQGLATPLFQELNNQFRVTLYAIQEQKVVAKDPQGGYSLRNT